MKLQILTLVKFIVIFSSLVILFSGCTEKIVYETDPRFFNDAFHGNIIGKVKQISSNAEVIVRQIDVIDSVEIDGKDGSFKFTNLEIGNYDLIIETSNYRTYQQYNVKVEGAGTTYLGEIDLSTIPDLIQSHYPEDRAEIAFDRIFNRLSISVIFTSPMDRESVEKAFSTYPETEGKFFWGTYTQSNYYRYFTESDAYAGFNESATITTYSKISSFTYVIAQKDCYVDTTYLVSISEEAQDTTGNNLRFPLDFTFSTVQSSSTQNGIITSPSHGDIDVNLINQSGITVTFPRRMDKESTERSISIIPESDVVFLWPQKNELKIYTGGIFMADTLYEIVIDSTAMDLDGIKLGEQYAFSFRTSPVEISNTNPDNGEVFVDVDNDIRLTFNSYMMKSSVISAISFSPDIYGNLSWYYNSKNTLEFDPSNSLKPNTKYTVTVSKEAVDIFGNHLKDPYKFEFVTRPE